MFRAHAVRFATALLIAVPLLIGCRSDADRLAEASDGTLISPYLAIGEVLADDSVRALPELAAKVVEAGQSRSAEPGVDAMLGAAGRIASPDIATARLMYGKMSEGMIAYLAAHPDQREGLMLIHCPMTFNNEGGYWVQREGKILNPYEGSMMLHCGAKLDWADYRAGAPPSGDAKVEGM
jgi:Cu(I)/Ag(I) efflux system membrane fusion protein